VTTAPANKEALVRTRVKVCGITRAEDARLAIGHGAWALGMILWPASPRHVKLEAAIEIAGEARRSAEVAGVFVDQPLEEVTGLANEIGLSLVQLHGSEGPQFCREIARSTGARVIKAFRVQGRDVLAEMGKFYDVDLHLLDSYRAGVPGGTGETFDWSFLAGRRRGNVPLLLSGGLTPENVGAAIETVGPWAVDVASGVESAPGIKDPESLSQFFAAVEGAVSPRRARAEPPLTGAEDEVLTLEYTRRQAREERQN
jgi:phosphoribosylanthranilate isomerase